MFNQSCVSEIKPTWSWYILFFIYIAGFALLCLVKDYFAYVYVGTYLFFVMPLLVSVLGYAISKISWELSPLPSERFM